MMSAMHIPSMDANEPSVGFVACPNCSATLPPDARFCLQCGKPLQATGAARPPVVPGVQASWFPKRVNLAVFISLLIGVGCILAALVTGVVFAQQNLVDWQAVQLWRVQWLLGAIAFFLLALLLNNLRYRPD